MQCTNVIIVGHHLEIGFVISVKRLVVHLVW